MLYGFVKNLHASNQLLYGVRVKADLRQAKRCMIFVKTDLRQVKCYMVFVKTDLRKVKRYMVFAKTDLRQVKRYMGFRAKLTCGKANVIWFS